MIDHANKPVLNATRRQFAAMGVAITNQGTSDRVHLAIDVEVDDWLAGMLLAAAA